MANKTMTRTQVYIPTDLYEEAKLYADRTGKNISQLIRDGLEDVMYSIKKEKKNPLKGLAGKFSAPGGKSNIAMKHNEIYEL